MSEPKLISPMLDDFDMGAPISDHNGVRCCPAMRKNSDEKYIVKVISIPETQTKLDALLLTGAFSDNQSALSYFEELANGFVDEKKILDNLSQLEGFISFEDCQIVPMEDAVGYDVYLLSEYRRTLARQNRKKPMTQLEAVNLGLDLCAALSVCRRSGYLYVDLKPSNIYVVGDKEYKIGDLGFVRINSLKYETLQDKYRSPYTAPELEDVFAPLNETMDIYAVGLILYQIFNGGTLPFDDQQSPNGNFAAPAYADEEMAEIILKACASDPSERWQDPADMGQAIVSYMQKNGVYDTPLVGPLKEESPVDVVTEAPLPEETTSDLISKIEDLIEENAVETTEDSVKEPVNAAEIFEEESAESVEADNIVPIDTAAETENSAEEQNPVEAAESKSNTEFVVLDDKVAEIIADVDENYDGITDEVSDILNQIDALTAHEVPAPVVAPEPVEIKIPEPIAIDDIVQKEKDEDKETTEVGADVPVDNGTSFSESAEKEISEEEKPYVPKKKRTGLVIGIILILVLALAAAAYYFYTNYYLQTIDAIIMEGSEDSLQVIVDTEVDESILTVICADSHGNKVSAPVVAGMSAFSGLTPDTAYTITVEVDGFHKLVGTTSKVYATPVQTKILQIRAITGSENGSVILSFAVDGPDSEQWNVVYSAEGEAERVATFTDHMITLTGLTIGKEYTFSLEPASDLYISGETETTYVARDVLSAENLRITSFVDGVLTARWDVPAGETVANWSVRCYNDAEYNETVSTEDNMITFQNLDENFTYTIEVTAADMSVSQRTSVAANVVTISDFYVRELPSGMLSLTWKANRDIPLDGWVLNYSVDGIDAVGSVTTEENTVEISVVPNSSYSFNIYDNAGNEVLGGPFTYTITEAADFNAYAVTKDNITARLCKTPAAEEWSYQDLEDEEYINLFVVGDKISVVLSHDADAEESTDTVLITYAIYDENDQLVNYSHSSQEWESMWENNYCELNVPTVPVDAGTYNMVIYFNGTAAGAQKFEITT